METHSARGSSVSQTAEHFPLFPVLLLLLCLIRVVWKEITGCNVVNRIGVCVGAGRRRRVQLCSVKREGEERGGSGMPELHV